MSNETLFFVFGVALAVSAVLFSLFGLRSEKFPGKAFPLVILWFAILVGGATTFAILHAKDEDKSKAAEFSAENAKITKEEGSPEPAKPPQVETNPKPVKGAGDTLKVSADPSKLAFNTKILVAKHPGKIKIILDNPSSIQHNIAIEHNGKVIAESPLVAEGKTSITAELGPGTSYFLCTVPGHAEAGMEGILDVTP